MEFNKGLFNEEQLEIIDNIINEYNSKLKCLQDEIIEYKPKEKSKEQLEMEDRLNEIENREKAIYELEKQNQVKQKLKEKGVSEELYKFLNVGDDADTFINEFAEIMNKTVLDGSYKPNVHKSTKDIITKEQFAGMGYMERSKLQETNPTLYAKLSE